MGGFGKEPEDYPDPFHSYLAIAALASHSPSFREGVEQDLSLQQDLGVGRLNPVWNVEVGVGEWLKGEITKLRTSTEVGQQSSPRP